MHFSDAARSASLGDAPPDDVSHALAVLGPESEAELGALSTLRRAELADRFVRNLRTLSIVRAPELHRRLLEQVDASPRGAWSGDLRDPMGLMALRNQVKYVLTAVGFDWEEMSRLQACVGGLSRWIESNGGGSARLLVGERDVRFELQMPAADSDPAVVEHSPMALALKDCVQDFRVTCEDGAVRFSFAVHP